jgi:hypothetical protein
MISLPLERSKIPAIGGLLKASSVSVILVIGQVGLEHMPPVTVFPSKSIIRNVVKGSRLLGVPTGNTSPVQTMVMSAVARSIMVPSLDGGKAANDPAYRADHAIGVPSDVAAVKARIGAMWRA